MASAGLRLRVGGQWLQSRGAWGDLAYSTAWPGGCDQASWSMSAKYAARLAMLVRGAPVVVSWGGWPLFRGFLSEPDWQGSSVSLTALGLSRLGEQYVALDSGGNGTNIPSTAVDQAISRGLPWTRDATVGSPAISVDLTTPLTVSALLDAAGLQTGQRWGVDAFGVAYFAPDPTPAGGPTYLVSPGAADLGIADDNYASNIVMRYDDSGTGTYQTVVYPPFGTVGAYEARYGHAETVYDATGKGPMLAATASAIAQSAFTRYTQRPGWTNGLTLAHGELLSPGGKPIHPAAARAGVLVRAHGVRDEVAMTSYTDFVAGKVSYTDGSDQVNIDPVGLVARSLEDVLTQSLNDFGFGEDAA